MKKYLLTFLLSIIGFIGFSSATNYSFTYSNGYTPSTITFDEEITLTSSNISSYSCPNGGCSFNFTITNQYGEENSPCGVVYDDYYSSDEDCGNSALCVIGDSYGSCTLPAGTYNLTKNEDEEVGDINPFLSIVITDGNSSEGGAGTEGTNPDVSLGGQIIENGTSALSPIITSIFSVMGEFIPYVVYIGIGILLCTLGFTAIKWLMNWLSGKITKYFK